MRLRFTQCIYSSFIAELRMSGCFVCPVHTGSQCCAKNYYIVLEKKLVLSQKVNIFLEHESNVFHLHFLAVFVPNVDSFAPHTIHIFSLMETHTLVVPSSSPLETCFRFPRISRPFWRKRRHLYNEAEKNNWKNKKKGALSMHSFQQSTCLLSLV